MERCGVFDVVDHCSTTNLKTTETLLNIMAPSRKREEPDTELGLGLRSTKRFKDEAIPDIQKSFLIITLPVITAEVCGADAKLFPPVEEKNSKASIKKGNKNKDGKDGMHLWDVREMSYAAKIRDHVKKSLLWLGTFDTACAAAARVLRGAKAKLNFPPAEEEGESHTETKKKGNRNQSPSASNTVIPVESSSREGLEEELGMDPEDTGVSDWLRRYSRKGYEELGMDPEDTGVVSDWLRRYSRKEYEELGMDPENTSIISDLLRFVRDKEIYKKVGKAWKRLYLFYNTPNSKSLIAAMANYLEFGIYVLDPTNLLSWSELEMTNVLASIPNRHLIWIPAYHHRDINNVELKGSCLLEFVHGLVSSCGDEQIIVFATDNRDLHDAARQHPFNEYVYIHKSSPRPDEGEIVKEGENVDEGEIVDGGEIVQFDIIKQKPLVDVDLNFPPVEEKIRNPEIKKKGDCNQSPSVSASSTVTHVKSSSWKGFEELGMDPENTGIIFDLKRFKVGKELFKLYLKRFKVGKELFKLFGKSLTRFYLLYDPPGADRSSLIAAMADFLEYRIHNLDVTSFSSLSELRNMLSSITNRSLIWIQDSDQCAGMLPDLNTNELRGSCLLKFVDGLLLSCGDERIIVFTTNNRDLHDAARCRPFNKDIYIHKSSPQPVALPAEGEIVELNSFEQKPLVDFDATNSRAHQSSVFVSNPEKKNTRGISKRRCMTESVRSLIDSTTRISSTDFDAPDNKTHLLRAYHLLKKDTIEGLHRECLTKNVPNLDDSRKQELLLDFDATENKAHLFRAYQILQSASSSRRPISLPDGGHIVLLDPLDQSTENMENVARADQCSPTVFVAEKKMVRKTLKRKCRTMSVIFAENHQHFGRRCAGAPKSLGAMRICGNHGINHVSTLKRIHKQHGIHQWPFQQKWAKRKGYSVGDKRPFKVSRLSMEEKLDSRLQFIHMSQFARSSPRALALPDRGEIVEPTALSSSEFAATNNRAHLGGAHVAKRICRQLVIHCETTAKRIRRQLGTRWWLFKQSAIGLPHGGHILYLPEKKIVRKTLKRKCRSISVLSLEDHKQHVDRRWEDAAKSHGTKCIRRQLVVHRSSTAKRTNKQHGIHLWPFQRSAICVPDRGHILSLSEKKIVRKTLKRKCRSMSVLGLVDRQQHVDRRWEDAAKNIGAKRICRQLVIHRVSIAKCICRQHGIHHRWPFEREWATMKGYSLGDERPVEVIRLSTDGKLVSRRRRIYISWLGRFSPWRLALPGGLIVGPIALSSSEFAGTNNIAQCVGQDQRGSGSSGFENERTREQEDPKEINKIINSENVRRLRGHMKRADAAKFFGVSVSKFKRKCRDYGIYKWPRVERKKDEWRPPDQHDWNTEIGSIAEMSSDWDFYFAFDEVFTPCQHPMPTIPDTMPHLSCSEPAPFQQPMPTIPDTTPTVHTMPHLACFEPAPCQQPMATIPSTMSTIHTMPHLAFSEPALCQQPMPTIPSTMPTIHTMPHLACSEPALCQQSMPTISGTMPTIHPMPHLACSEPAPCQQPMPTIPVTKPHLAAREESTPCQHPMPTITYMMPHLSCSEPAPFQQPMPTVPRTMGSLDDLRNLLPLDESVLAGNAFGSINRTVPSCSYPVSSQTMSTVPHTTGSSDDLRNLLALEEEPFGAGHVSESINLPVTSCFDPAPSQSMPTILHTMPTNPLMMSLLTERQDTMSVNLKATYEGATIKFRFPVTSGINELKKEVSKTLECELGSFRVEYMDEEGEWILMARDENVREYLRLVISLGNQVTKLKVHKVPNTTNLL